MTTESIGRAPSSARITLGRVVQAESSNYFLLLGTTLFMVAFGLVMVLSSSSVDSHLNNQGFFARFLNQGEYALIGVPLMLFVSRLPVRFLKRIAAPALGFAVFLQFLVVFTPLGHDAGGNNNWLRLGGGVTFQPSELIKIGLILWLGMFAARRIDRIAQWKRFLLPCLIVGALSMGLVIKGNDLGTTMILVGILLGCLFFAGVRLRQLGLTGLVALALAGIAAATRPSRVIRIFHYLHPSVDAYMTSGWQLQNGYFALASGGFFGVGLGNSQAKWAWLPAASTDFIFAIVGEELGLIGAIVVVLLFVMLAVVMLRILRAAEDPFVRTVTAGVMIWIVGQGLVNIAVVLGVLPVLGVPLPLISAGGTALISCLVGIGVVLSFARHQRSSDAR